MPKPRRSLFALIGDIPTLVTDLVKGEIDQLKAELIVKFKALGIGAGIIVGAVVILLFAVGVLLTSAVLALALVMPGWLAALLVAVVLIIAAGLVGLVGYRRLKLGLPPVPTTSINSVKKDLDTIKGMGK
ncbi:MAG: phage holin family protein [Microbacteriaceae bacterium]|nr:phage holin family protein [Microbacteriaceae bacterium]